MGVFQNNLMGAAAAAASAGGDNFYSHQIANSCRFNRADGSYLSRTIQSGGNLRKWTFSCWFKLTASAGFGNNQYYLMTEKSGSPYDTMIFDVGSDNLFYYQVDGKYLQPNGAFRDISAWGHLVVVYDSDNGTADDRRIVYLNGTRLGVNDSQALSQNVDSSFNSNTVHYIGARQDNNASYYGDFYLADVIWSDGYAYAASDFAETKNGVWIPKEFSGSYGTTGYHLKFESSSDLGNDSSGNNNDWTTNNISTHDQMLDTPTFNSSSNGGNFATLNPLNTRGSTSVATQLASEGNLKWTPGATQDETSGTMSIGAGGVDKVYIEVYCENNSDTGWFGVYDQKDGSLMNAVVQSVASAVRFKPATGQKVTAGTSSNYIGDGSESNPSGVIFQMAVDVPAGKIWWGRNNAWGSDGADHIDDDNVAFTTLNTDGTYLLFTHTGGASIAQPDWVFNFGQDGTFAGNKTAQGNSDDTGYGNFYYSPPTGFKALCSGNVSVVDEVDPAQTDDDYPQKLFGMLQYTGNNSERTIDTSFQIDYSWARSTVQGQNWYTLDTTRGYFGASSNNYYMKLDLDDAEDTLPQYNFKAQSGSDITITGGTWFNSGSHTQQMWNWRLNGGTTSTNSTGSVSVTQQVDPSGHFSVSTYSGAGGTGTIGHGLSAVPTFVVVKQRNASNSWATYAKGAGPELYGNLATNTAFQDAVVWQDTTPSSSLVYLGDNNEVNHSGRTYLAYCWADCEGYIKSGKYIGNGNADGTFIYLGFKPALFVIKHVSSGDDPLVWDSLNGPYNPISKTLSMHDNSAIVDNTNRHIDFLSNGVKIRTSNSNANSTNSDGIVYLAMAENPFKYATAR